MEGDLRLRGKPGALTGLLRCAEAARLAAMSIIAATREAVLEDRVFLAVRLGGDMPLMELIDAAMRGGLRLIELTLTTPGALDAIAALADNPDCVVGAGTVLTAAEARDVAAAGGRFAMSPAFDPAVIDAAHESGLLAVPGAGSATEILNAHRAGADMVKVFPSGALGGPEFLRKIRGPLPQIPLVPTSGPTAENLGDYFDAGAVAVGVGAAVFADPSPIEVEAAARRVRAAMDRARSR
jgi:2-dehydro-3-deoxyphosphogluconate aldolase/(4S)-4-hydroxy-2-oxoglutarate aldolase